MSTGGEIDEKMHGFTIFWRIVGFECEQRENFLISSPVFKMNLKKKKWRLEIKQRNQSLAAYLFKEGFSKAIEVVISVCLLTDSGWISMIKNEEVKFETCRIGCGVHHLMSLEDLKLRKSIYLPNGSLTVSFNVVISRDKFSVISIKENSQLLIISQFQKDCTLEHQVIKPLSTLKYKDLESCSFPSDFKFDEIFQKRSKKAKKDSNKDISKDLDDMKDLSKQIDEKKLDFVTIRTDRKDFYVLEAIVCIKSQIFHSLCQKKMRKNDCIEVKDVDSETMTLLINFLHYGTIDNISLNSAVKLCVAADKYKINSLKEACIHLMKKDLSTENVCGAFILADLHQNKELKDFAQEYFCQNSKVVLLSKEWQRFLRSYPEVSSEILRKWLIAVVSMMPQIYNSIFQSNMAEGKNDFIDLDSLSDETIRLLVDVLHIGTLDDNTWNTVIKLYRAADKCKFDSLKKACTGVLQKELSTENICGGFILADFHQDNELMNCMQEYFSLNSKVVLPSKEWQDFTLTYTELATDILSKWLKDALCTKPEHFNVISTCMNKIEDIDNLTGTGVIEDEAMKCLIHFSQYGTISNASIITVLKIYYIANKYQIYMLKQECIKLIKKGLSVENICDAFILADFYRNDDLMNSALEYFCQNSKKVLPTEAWRDLMITHAELSVEILCKLSEKM